MLIFFKNAKIVSVPSNQYQLLWGLEYWDFRCSKTELRLLYFREILLSLKNDISSDLKLTFKWERLLNSSFYPGRLNKVLLVKWSSFGISIIKFFKLKFWVKVYSISLRTFFYFFLFSFSFLVFLPPLLNLIFDCADKKRLDQQMQK